MCYRKRLAAIVLFLCFQNLCAEGPTIDVIMKSARTEEKRGNFSKALKLFGKASNMDPENIRSCIGCARTLCGMDRFQDSIDILQKTMRLRPDKMDAPVELAKAHYLNGNVKKSRFIIETLLSCLWDSLDFYAQVEIAERNFEIAKIILESILAINPSSKICRFHLSQCHLAMGDLTRGFEEYESREKSCFDKYCSCKKPELRDTNFSGKRVLVFTESGSGNVFNFVRYARLINERGGKVFVKLHNNKVRNILSLCPYINKIIDKDVAPEDFDYKIYLMSLPRLFKTTVKNIPSATPYLYADKKLEQQWRQKLSKDKNLKVGICWDGKCFSNDAFVDYMAKKRTFDFENLSRLADVKGVSFYSLQKFVKEKPSGKLVINNFGKDFDESHGAFMDTAAIMKSLDLVITIDGPIADLAGGLGVPVWTLLPYESDWKWLENRSDSPWYPNMKLFRQPKSGDWKSVVEEIRHEIDKLARSSK
ncbi:hypothetical protein HN446_03765 [bacterium]|jgi:tetratricopeptide (TPR) repeat protein|nr:hypothetical protein [bacterium]